MLGDVMIVSPLPNHKTDINNKGPISTDVIGMSWEYVEANWTRKMEIWNEHIEYTKSFFYFLANDPSVPAAVMRLLHNLLFNVCSDKE
jgi:hypothetical protein